MKGKTHAALGLSSTLFLLSPIPENLILYSCFTVIGSLIPDIDTKYGLIHKTESCFLLLATFVYSLIVIPLKSLSIIGIILFIYLSYKSSSFDHRTITHSLLWGVIFTLSLLFISPRILMPFSIGYFMHLLADSFTKAGVPILLPYSKNKYGPKLIKSSGEVDNALYFIGILFIFIYVFKIYSINELVLAIKSFCLPIYNFFSPYIKSIIAIM